MKLQVNPTRMELLHLRRKLALARRGHDLLKDKQDELMTRLLNLIKVLRELRERVEKELEIALKRVIFAYAGSEPQEIEIALMLPSKEFKIDLQYMQILNLKVPKFVESISGEMICYGFAQTPGELDAALVALDRVVKDLLELAEKEKALELLAREIEKTRQRVNALEYIVIPKIENTIKFIDMVLEEMAREEFTRLKKIKRVMEERKTEVKQEV